MSVFQFLFNVVDLCEIENKLEENVQLKRMNDLYITEDGHRKEVHFSLSSMVEEALAKIHKLSESRLFRIFWEKQFHTLGAEEKALSMADIVELIWNSTEDELRNLIETLVSEEITLRQVEITFKDYKGKYGLLEDELGLLNRTLNEDMEISWIRQVVEKIRQFFSLKDCQNNAKSILDIGKILNLKGDFSVFEAIVNQVRISLCM